MIAPSVPPGPRVGLFVTCLVDLFRPGVGFAAVKLLRDAGCNVVMPAAQACCGQTAINTADHDEARANAQDMIAAFEDFDHVVVPSGACARTLKRSYAGLFAGDAAWLARAEALSARVHELTGFLVDVLGVSAVGARVDGSVTYHDGCASLRDLGVSRQPRLLLGSVEGLELLEMADAGACCGMGHCGDPVSATRKADSVRKAGAGILLSGDLGCLMHIAGRLRRQGSAVEVRHVAEVLAGMHDMPPIGGPRTPARGTKRHEGTGRP